MNSKDALRKGFTHLPCTLHNHRWCLLTQSKSLIHAALLRVPVHIKADEMQRQWIFVCHANWLPVNVGARADAAFVLKYTAFIMCWFFFCFYCCQLDCRNVFGRIQADAGKRLDRFCSMQRMEDECHCRKA